MIMSGVDTEANFDLQISSEEEDSGCVSKIGNMRYYVKFFQYTGLLFTVCCSVALPPLMIYSGVTFGYCDKFYTDLLLVGGIFWYIELFSIALLWKIERNLNDQNECKRNLTFILVIIFTLALLGWWLAALQRYFPDKEFYHSLIWENEDCRFWVANLSLWIVSIPLWLLSYITVTMFISVIISICFFYVTVLCCYLMGKEWDDTIGKAI